MPRLKQEPPFHPAPPRVLSRIWSPPAIGTLTAAVLTAYPCPLELPLKQLTFLEDYLPWLFGILRSVPLRAYTLLFGFAVGFGCVKGTDLLRWRALRYLLSYQGWITNPKAFQNKIWALGLKLCLPSLPYSTYQFQAVLPRQPLPKLDDTLDLYLQACRQLLTKDEFLMTTDVVQEFRKNEGPKLQSYLEKRSQQTLNWLSDYWMMAAYLTSRQPLAIYSNYYQANHVGPHRTTDPLARGGCIVQLYAKYEELVSSHQLQPVMAQDMVPLCMHGYRYIFNTCRIPGEHMDTVAGFPGKHHIVVIRKGHYFLLDLVHSDGKGKKRRLTAEEIKIQLKIICNMAESRQAIPAVAALTAQNRTTWAKQRKVLAEHNQAVLDAVESSMFVLVLDHRSPKDQHDRAKMLLAGNGDDRWFDKSFVLTIFDDASCGTNTEHAVLDAMIFATVTEYQMCYEEYEGGDVVKDPRNPPRQLPPPKELTWCLDGMETMLKEATLHIHKLIDDIDVFLMNAEYGKGFIKQCRMSPDGYIQMAMQLAWYREYKEFPKTYEPSTGRFYLLGRTETVHPGNLHCLRWVKAMEDPNSDQEELINFLRQAVKAQTQFRLQATVGKGCDRHLLGLYCAARELGMDIPNIFRDKAWQMPFRLSTSQTPTNVYVYRPDTIYELATGGFGPSSHDGYGVSYVLLGDNSLNFVITSWKSCEDTSSPRWAAAIATALSDMKKLFS